MTHVTVQILHQDIRAVRLETNTIIPVVDMAVLNDYNRRPERIPSIRVTRLDARVGTVRVDGQVVVRHVAAVRDNVEPIG